MLLGLCSCSLLRTTQTIENSTAQKKSEFPGKEKKIHSNNVSLIKRYLAQKTQNCNKRSVVMREKGDIDKRIMCWWEAFSCRSKNTAGRKWNCLRGRKKKCLPPSQESTALCSVNLCHRVFILLQWADLLPLCCLSHQNKAWDVPSLSLSPAPVPLCALHTQGLSLQRSIRDWLLHPLQSDIDKWNRRSCGGDTAVLHALSLTTLF